MKSFSFTRITVWQLIILVIGLVACQQDSTNQKNENKQKVIEQIKRNLDDKHVEIEGDKVVKSHYCTWDIRRCKLPKEAHNDPYLNSHLCEKYNPEEIDYSKEYLNLLHQRDNNKKDDKLNEIKKNDASMVWNFKIHGTLDTNYHRIDLDINSSRKDSTEKLRYHILGNYIYNKISKPVYGEIEITNAYEIETYKNELGYHLYFDYQLNTDSSSVELKSFIGKGDIYTLKKDSNKRTTG